MIFKRVVFLILFSLLLVSPVFAQQKIEISSIKVDSKAFPGSEVIFQVRIKNLQIKRHSKGTRKT